MHSCWHVPEILQMILEQLGQSRAGDTALARLAVVCRRFHHPALDLLWRQQYSLVPLLKCLPGVWSGSDDSFSLICDLDVALNPLDWTRLLSNAARIRRLTLYPIRREMREAVEFLAMSMPVDCLLPNLEYLAWSPDDFGLFPYVRLFVGPKLRSIELAMNGPGSHLSILPWLASRYPLLESVELFSSSEFMASNFSRRKAISTMVHKLSNVRHLTVSGLDTPAMRHLASLSSLQSLIVDVIDDLIFSSDLSVPAAFPALRKLTIGNAPIACLINFFNALSDCALTEIFIEASSFDESQVSVLISAIHDHVSHASLTLLSLGPPRSELDSPALRLQTLHPTTIRPLLAFRKLIFLDLETFRLSFDDRFVAEMAAAWPEITRLCFSTHYVVGDPSPPPLLSLCGLSAFVQHCPHLKVLRIPVDARNIPAPPNPVLWARQTALTSLHVVDSPIDSVLATAGVLSSMFPALEQVLASDESEEEVGDEPRIIMADPVAHARWKEVEKLVPMFAKIREEEVTRAGRLTSGTSSSSTGAGPSLATPGATST
ncbi:hypothetical protein DFH06DRAFT_602450 [Mycena polygramma]|nr:hypothetical protein DFH06DRAFT_602450 [Mycena polygramma]